MAPVGTRGRRRRQRRGRTPRPRGVAVVGGGAGGGQVGKREAGGGRAEGRPEWCSQRNLPPPLFPQAGSAWHLTSSRRTTLTSALPSRSPASPLGPEKGGGAPDRTPCLPPGSAPSDALS